MGQYCIGSHIALSWTGTGRFTHSKGAVASEDNHVLITFERRRIMQDRVMEFYAEVCQVGSFNGFSPFVPLVAPILINVVVSDDVTMGDYNSEDDSGHEEEASCHSTKKN
ncbi:hypothetical protein PIB30_019113 [Stylosanthes scabra]|uniref:Uncharacterized protein n=1 Tax=Stylosanthes scabra TaxID=79078 RepID=A0ABU6V8X2_9FABA|nr:hypothetical protein [Stylosanthes scabra]